MSICRRFGAARVKTRQTAAQRVSGAGAGASLFVSRNSTMTNGVCLTVRIVVAHARADGGRVCSSFVEPILLKNERRFRRCWSGCSVHDSSSRCECDSLTEVRALVTCVETTFQWQNSRRVTSPATFQWSNALVRRMKGSWAQPHKSPHPLESSTFLSCKPKIHAARVHAPIPLFSVSRTIFLARP